MAFVPRTISLRGTDENLVLEAYTTKYPSHSMFREILKASMCSHITVGVMLFQVGSMPDIGDIIILCTILK